MPCDCTYKELDALRLYLIFTKGYMPCDRTLYLQRDRCPAIVPYDHILTYYKLDIYVYFCISRQYITKINMVACSLCSRYPTWTCEGCHKNLCDEHKDMRDHKCRDCYYCNKPATGYHENGCNKYVCDIYGCDKHIRACHMKTDNNYNNYHNSAVACPMCVNGRIITGYQTSERCFVCNGNCCI